MGELSDGKVTFLFTDVEGNLLRRGHQLEATGAAPRRLDTALRTRETRPGDLPLQPTALLGRDREVAAALERLLRPEVRLLTLTGPGGTGKTRLALEVAVELVNQFADGVVLVPLAALSDPELVPATIAQTLGLREVSGRSLLEGVAGFLRDKQLLLLLDNFEQILPAAPAVAEFLAACPRLKVLVTSRAPLELSGEHEQVVPPLPLPDLAHLPPPEALLGYGAVALFVQRAAALKPEFALTEDNAPAVAAICCRLDGLPLALELAAARIRLLSPAAILSRLERRLPLLTSGARDLPQRQQTLRNTIAWSNDLLNETERLLFRRLAVFAGGFTLEAAEAVADPDGTPGIDVLDDIGSLVAQSLLVQQEGPDGEPRIGMLETIREYGLEQLAACGEAEVTRGRHAAYFLALAEKAEPKLLGAEQVTWLQYLEAERENFRAVLARSRDGEVAADVGLLLVGALQWYWRLRGPLSEGRVWTEAMLGLPGAAAPTAARARALNAAARLANLQADFPAARALAVECAAIARTVGDLATVAHALDRQAFAEMGEGNAPLARSLWEESVALFREVSDQHGLAIALLHLAVVTEGDGDYEETTALRKEAAAIAGAIGERSTLALALIGLATLARLREDEEGSTALLTEALTVTAELGFPVQVLPVLAGLAGAAARTGDHGRAARLLGAVAAVRTASDTPEPSPVRAAGAPDLAEVRAALSDGAFAVAWAEGQAMTLEQATAFALNEPASVAGGPDGGRVSRVHLLRPAEGSGGPISRPTTASPGPAEADGLSEREREVLRLIAVGKSNPEIAAELVIRVHTVIRHANHIYAKLGVGNRTEAAAFAHRHNLI
jgi:non-specific serine/threonine protein kinase